MRNEFQFFMLKTILFLKNYKSFNKNNDKNNSDGILTVKEIKDDGNQSPAYCRKSDKINREDLAHEENDSEKTLVFNFKEKIIVDNDKNLRSYLKEKVNDSNKINYLV